MTGYSVSEETKRLVIDQPFLLESGEVLPQLEIAYRSWGTLAAEGDNAVVVCHALTGSADADRWWPCFFGAGRVLDPARDFIICSNVLGGCYGTSGPASRAPDGDLWGARFPAVTIRDQVRAQMLLADKLGIRRINLVLGGSMGGLHVLEWGLLDPQRVQALATIAGSGRHSAWCVAWSEAQRMALGTDPKYRDGHYHPDDPPEAGLAAARAIAMLTYRSPQSLTSRFGHAADVEIGNENEDALKQPAVNSWLHHHGQMLVDRFDANSYRRLLDALDSHNVARGRGDYENVLAGIRQPVLVGAVLSDALYLPDEQRELAQLIPDARLIQIDSVHGHDGFLIDAREFIPALLAFRQYSTNLVASRNAEAALSIPKAPNADLLQARPSHPYQPVSRSYS